MRRVTELPVQMQLWSASNQRHRLKRSWVTQDKLLSAMPRLRGWSVVFLRMRITA